MGLFENPYVDPGKAKKEVRCKEYVTLARQAAQASITLLKNEHSLLPLDRSMKVALIGPKADNCYNMLGDYTAPQEEENVKTVLDGIRAKLSSSQVEYVKGCSIRDTVTSDIEQAVTAAQRSEVVIAVVRRSQCQ